MRDSGVCGAGVASTAFGARGPVWGLRMTNARSAVQRWHRSGPKRPVATPAVSTAPPELLARI